MAERLDKLQKIVSEAQWWSDFAGSGAWAKLKERIEDLIIKPAKDAFWTTDTDNLNDEKIARNTLSQKTTVRTALKIINLVEKEKTRLKQAQGELEKIEKSEKKQKGEVKNGK